MIESLTITAGAARAQVRVPAGFVTVVIGPNNAGKSLLLREIANHFRMDSGASGSLLLGMAYRKMVAVELRALVTGANERRLPKRRRADMVPPGSDSWIVTCADLNGQPQREARVEFPGIEKVFEEGDDVFDRKRRLVGAFAIHLDGTNRLNFLNAAGPQAPDTPLSALLVDGDARQKLSAMLHDSIGLHFGIDASDPLTAPSARLCSSPIPPSVEESHSSEARAFFKSQPRLETFSDGTRAFVGTLGSLLCGDFRVLTIDEPEAFLHPPLARKLGRHLSSIAAERNAAAFVATHSAEFLMGCVQSGKEVSILRLTYDKGSSTATVLPSSDLLPLMREPLLRSSNVLSALFHRGAVVCEGDTDRAFYDEVNLRLLDHHRGAGDCAFLNANSKQSVRKIVEPLRRLGVPAAAIVDIDVVKDGGAEWSGLLKSARIPEALHQGLANTRVKIKGAFERTGKDMKIDGGVNVLNQSDREAALSLFRTLADYGIFVVPTGEIESWLREFEIPGHGPPWLVAMFQRMGADRSSADYVHPGPGDVWAFITHVAGWLSNPDRLGMPSLP